MYYHGKTDSLGNVEIGNLLPGPYSLILIDPKLGELGLTSESLVEFVAVRDSTIVKTIEVRSLADNPIEQCLADRGPPGGLLVFSRVVTKDGNPVADAEVRFGSGGNPERWIKARADGSASLCLDGSHRNETLTIHARRGRGTETVDSRILSGTLTEVLLVIEPERSGATPNSTVGQIAVTVHGIAYDSLHAAPLAGAFIGIGGSDRTTTTDEHGEFSFYSLPPGSYILSMQHDVLDTIGLSGIMARTTITDGRETVRIAVPSLATFWRAACRAPLPAGSSGMIYGTVRGVDGHGVATGAHVRATWTDTATGKASDGPGQPSPLEVVADSTGSYAICGVPTTVNIHLEARSDATTAVQRDVAPLHDLRFARGDLQLRRTPPVDLSRPDAAAIRTKSGWH